jgi:hypothetical protein
MAPRYTPPSAQTTAGGAPILLRDAALPLIIIAVFVLGAGTLAVARLAALVAAPTGRPVPAWGAPILRAVFDSAGSSLDPLIGPDGSRWMFWLTAVLVVVPLLSGAGGLWWWATARLARVGDPTRALAKRRDHHDMTGKGAEQRARELRPSLANRPVDRKDLGFRLGIAEPGDYPLWASEEDTGLIIAGPRAGKTSALVVPAILTAPGPVIATSNKVDIHVLTGKMRRSMGEVFVLDPQRMSGIPQTWWWDPLRGIADIAEARRFLGHFVATVGGGSDRSDGYFTPATERLLSQLVLAAACSRRTLRDVQLWLADRAEAPAELLRGNGYLDAAIGVESLLSAAPEQQDGVFETALTALSCLESEPVLRYITPPRTWVARRGEQLPDPNSVRELDIWRFLVGYRTGPDGRPIPRDTLYALTREGAGTAAPVVAALVDHLLLTASAAASACGGRVDPPLRVVLDEAANICPIKNLPDLYSYFGSMSIQVFSFLQSYEQGVALWGKSGMRKLETAATIYLIGAGAHDSDFCEGISRLVGHHDVPTWSDQSSRGGGSVSRSFRREPILSASDIAALPKTHAVLLSSGRRPGLIRLTPWYIETEFEEISGHAAVAIEEVRRAAITALGPDNALAQHLQRTTAPDNLSAAGRP